MATTMTLKNIPDEIYEQLRQAAAQHHRSINSEAIACLERVLLPGKIPVAEHIERARKIRESLQGQRFRASDIAGAIRDGRA